MYQRIVARKYNYFLSEYLLCRNACNCTVYPTQGYPTNVHESVIQSKYNDILCFVHYFSIILFYFEAIEIFNHVIILQIIQISQVPIIRRF